VTTHAFTMLFSSWKWVFPSQFMAYNTGRHRETLVSPATWM